MKRRIAAILLCAILTAAAVLSSVADSLVPGDANGDGKVTVSDASLMMRYCVGLDRRIQSRSKIYADVNHNFEVDAEDAVMVLRSVAGLITLPATDALDNTLYQKLLKQSTLEDDGMTEWVARYIQSMKAGDRKKVICAAAEYLGTPYGTLDCSLFLKNAFYDAGISRDVYPGKSSDATLKWFRETHPDRLHNTDIFDWTNWKPGCVLIYVDDTGKATHVVLYVGAVDGEPIVMESRRSGCDGVRLGYPMESYITSTGSESVLTYYADPFA